MKSNLEKIRLREIPLVPECLSEKTLLKPFMDVEIASNPDVEILKLFPNLSKFKPKNEIRNKQLKVGVLLSGGQASGGHNVINGLLKGLHRLNKETKLIGFLNGPAGLVKNEFKELSEEFVLSYLNSGGFDMIGSGRTKIESSDQFKSALETVKKHELDGLVIIGGDDSNTNAAFLAEYFLAHESNCTVIGCPKTIDGDLKNDYIEQSFGFDTATKIYSETVGNLMTDLLSAKKYWFFIRLMGRSASHISLEVALQTKPNITLISEERRNLYDIVTEIVEVIKVRAKAGKNYGVVLIPEGLIEFLPSIPEELLEGQELSRDPHGNLEVSKIETERLLINLVKAQLDKSIEFSPQSFFLGYEGRSAAPSHFDANYCYALGLVASRLIAQGLTGRMATVYDLKKPVAKWGARALPLLPMLDFEERDGKQKAVIKKALIDLSSPLYNLFKHESEGWKYKDDYRSIGPIQFWGEDKLTQAITYTLSLG